MSKGMFRKFLPFANSNVQTHKNRKARLTSAFYCLVMVIFCVISFLTTPPDTPTKTLSLVGAIVLAALTIVLVVKAYTSPSSPQNTEEILESNTQNMSDNPSDQNNTKE